ncbi:MAG: heme/hemin ABC transporter substrate-binding protein [Gemmatimonadaceae bacterium]
MCDGAAASLALAATFAAARPIHAQGTNSERVVCVSKQINEFMFAIGAQGVLVGRDLTSIYPPAILKLTSIGYHRALNAEGIISLLPTLFLTDGNFGPAEVAAQIEKVGIPILTIKPGQSVDSAAALLVTLGKRFHRERAADSVASAMKTKMAAALTDTLEWAGRPRPRVLIMHFGQIANNYLGLRRGSIGDQMLRWAGGANALDSIGGMQRLTPEAIAKAAPDIIIATDVGFDRFGSAEKFAAMPGVDLTPAAKAHRIYRIEEDDVMYYGPRTVDALHRIEAILHPAAGHK